MRRVGVVTASAGETGEGLAMLQQMTEAVGALQGFTRRGVNPQQPDRSIQPSRERFLKSQRARFRIWNDWAAKTKQLALSPRIYGSVTTVMVPARVNPAHPVDETYGPEENNETFYPYKSRSKGPRHRDVKFALGLVYDE